MSNELIKKVYEHFGGVWPKRAEVILTTAEGWTGIKDIVGVFTEGWYDGDTVMHDLSQIIPDYDSKEDEPWMDEKEAWVIACTKDQFKVYEDGLNKPWMPEVGVECEAECKYFLGETRWRGCFYIGLNRKGQHVIEWLDSGDTDIYTTIQFRPIKTERDQLIEIIDSCNLSSGALADAILNAGYRKADGE